MDDVQCIYFFRFAINIAGSNIQKGFNPPDIQNSPIRATPAFGLPYSGGF
jgi:hypothetical protein